MMRIAIFQRNRSFMLGTFVVFALSSVIFGSLAASRGYGVAYHHVLAVAAIVLVVHVMALIAYERHPGMSAAFLLMSLCMIATVLNSWGDEVISPAAWLFTVLVFIAANIFGRVGALASTLFIGAIAAYLGALSSGFSLAIGTSILALTLLSASFGSMVEDQAGQHERYLASVAELRKTNQAAAMSLVAAEMAHEIRNPAAGLLSFLDNWKESSGGADAADKIAVVEREVERIMEIASRPVVDADSSDDVRGEDSVNLAGLAAEVIGLCRFSPGAREAVIEESLENACVMADAGRLRQAILNLMLNAMEFAGSDGVVRVTTRTGADDKAEIIVDDSGPGVPEAERALICRPLFTTRPKGTGMGLAVVSTVAGEYGGRLSITDSPLGGARFTLQLRQAKSANAVRDAKELA
ncbi:MAG: ATP-binding protein [Candidatus Hydrogenedentota bacterium]